MNTTADTIRVAMRRETISVRQSKRSNLLEQCRGLDEAVENQMSVVDMTSMAETMRKKGLVTGQLLQRIQHGLLLGPDHVSAFLATNGALVALVRILSGLNPALKTKAAYCLCNLSLAGGKTALKITKHASAYLLVDMDSSNPTLQDACCWTVGNLAAGCSESWHLLHSQGVLTKLLQLLSSPHDDVIKSAVYSLTHFVEAGRHNLKAEEVSEIITKSSPHLRQQNLSQMFFLLSCSPACDHLMCTSRVPELAASKLCAPSDLTNLETARELTFLIRTLGNLSAESRVAAEQVESVLCENLTVVKQMLNSSLSHVRSEMLWFLSNLLQFDVDVTIRNTTINIC